MTPGDEFAQKREEAVTLIRQHAPTRLQEPLIDLLRPAIALSATRANDSEIPIGASKFGGAPDVPEDFEWPLWNEKPLGFLAQINLEEVAAFDVEKLLPKSGLLSFFFFAFDSGYSENDAAWKGSWRVFHLKNETFVRLALPEELDSEQVQVVFACLVTPQAEWTTQLPSGVDLTTEEIEQIYFVFFEMFERPKPRHRLFGWPNEVQGFVADESAESSGDIDSADPNWNEAEAKRRIDQWRLLFQMDADWKNTGCEWGDDGTNHYMIRRSDLEAANFDDVWFISECG